MKTSVLRYYDEAVLNFFSNISINDGVEIRNAQTVLAIASRKGTDLLLSDDITPVLPMIVVTRTDISPSSATFMIKNQITRPQILKLNQNDDVYDGIEVMPFDLKYVVDFYSLQQEMHNYILEKMLFLTYKKATVKTLIDINNQKIEINPYIKDIAYSDTTTFTQVPDTSNRIFHGVFNFTLSAYLYNDVRAVTSVKEIHREILPMGESITPTGSEVGLVVTPGTGSGDKIVK